MKSKLLILFFVLTGKTAFCDTLSVLQLEILDTTIENNHSKIYYYDSVPFTGVAHDTFKIADRPRDEWTIQTLFIHHGFVYTACTENKGLYTVISFKDRRQDEYIKKQYVVSNANEKDPFYMREVDFREKNLLRTKTFDDKHRLKSVEDGYYDEFNNYNSVKLVEYEYYEDKKTVCKTVYHTRNNQKQVIQHCHKKLFWRSKWSVKQV